MKGGAVQTPWTRWAVRAAVLACCLGAPAAGKERLERFDKDPGWEGRNHRATVPEERTVRQDFGYSRTAHAGGRPGEVGGFITPAAEPAYYAKPIDPKTLNDPLTASGRLACKAMLIFATIKPAKPDGRRFNLDPPETVRPDRDFLDALEKICGNKSCEEYTDLAKSIADYKLKN